MQFEDNAELANAFGVKIKLHLNLLMRRLAFPGSVAYPSWSNEGVNMLSGFRRLFLHD